jgi:Lon protease-like protein
MTHSAADVVELPLFPLQTVLFPGGTLALRVFEPRYLDMVARCLREHGPFGVVAIRHGTEVGRAETFAVGTTAEIVDWNREPNGLLGLRAMGRRRFHLETVRRHADGLYLGRASWLPQPAPAPLPERLVPLADLLRGTFGPDVADARFDDAEWVGFRLAEMLPLAMGLKQSLLELAEPLARLERLAAILERDGRRGE